MGPTIGTGIGPILARYFTGDDEGRLRRVITLGYIIGAAGLIISAPLTNFGVVLLGILLCGTGGGIVGIRRLKGKSMQSWKTLDRTTVFTAGDGRFLELESHAVELPNGQTIDAWPWVVTPDYINVVAVTEEQEFLCFRQTKYAVSGLSLAIVGGYLEPGEDPLQAAQRELLEETGYAATSWTALGHYAVDGNRGCGTAHLYLARHARWTQPIDADDLEEQELLLLTRAEVEAALHNGEFKVLPWSAAVALALLQL